MSHAQLHDEASHSCSHDATGTGRDQRVERRRNGRSGDAPIDVLRQLPAVVVLERVPVPTLAIAHDGTILFGNTAFAEMVGYPQDSLVELAVSDVFCTVPAAVGGLSGVDALANLAVELRHSEGWTVRTTMSKSALMRSDDPVVLVTFENLTERLWLESNNAVAVLAQLSPSSVVRRKDSRARNSRK